MGKETDHNPTESLSAWLGWVCCIPNPFSAFPTPDSGPGEPPGVAGSWDTSAWSWAAFLKRLVSKGMHWCAGDGGESYRLTALLQPQIRSVVPMWLFFPGCPFVSTCKATALLKTSETLWGEVYLFA